MGWGEDRQTSLWGCVGLEEAGFVVVLVWVGAVVCEFWCRGGGA